MQLKYVYLQTPFIFKHELKQSLGRSLTSSVRNEQLM